jgi:predicted small lipoprotein YifL
MRALILAALLALAACGAEAPPQVPGGPVLSDFWSD